MDNIDFNPLFTLFIKMDLIEEGDDVILYLDKKRNYMVKVERNKEFHTHRGYLNLDKLIGEPFGVKMESSLGVIFSVLKPLIRDNVLKTDRRTQVLYPKDISYIIYRLGIGPGSRVAEAGTGSGALTMSLANVIKPSGKIYTYEINPKFQKVAAENIQRAKLMPYVEMKLGDITVGIEEENLDAIALDLATPWMAVPHAWEALKGSGMLLSFSPTIEQVIKTVKTINEYPFIEHETIELILRKINVAPDRTRPETIMVGHSGYLTSARKILDKTIKS
jgi:tRNA (adenine57-N1/adenine58-N1)-methyltransferase